MRFVTILLSITLVCGFFLACGCGPSETTKPPEGNPHKGFCPVMGGAVDYAKADKDPTLYEDYKEKRYYFCCAACDEPFRKDPEKYINNPVPPTKPAETPPAK